MTKKPEILTIQLDPKYAALLRELSDNYAAANKHFLKARKLLKKNNRLLAEFVGPSPRERHRWKAFGDVSPHQGSRSGPSRNGSSPSREIRHP